MWLAEVKAKAKRKNQPRICRVYYSSSELIIPKATNTARAANALCVEYEQVEFQQNVKADPLRSGVGK